MTASKNSLFTKLLGKIPLKMVLIVPFAIQTSAAVGLVGFFSFKNGQKAINDLASQLQIALSSNIVQEVEKNIKTPPAIAQSNANALANGQIDIVNTKGGYQLWQQIKLFPSVSYLYCGSQKGGELFGVLQDSARSQKFQLQLSNASTNNRIYSYDLDQNGNPSPLVTKETVFYNARLRPWYKAAQAAGKTTWSEIYLDFSTSLPTITASTPVYDKTGNSLIAVCAVDIFLPRELSKFLKTMKIGKSGQTFLIERSGFIIASSTPEPITVGTGKDTKRLKATESSNPVLRATGEFLSDKASNLRQIQSPVQLEYMLNGQRQFVQVTPFKDNLALDWLIVTVVPESDFMEQINANNRTTILLSIAALIVAIVVSIITSLWVTKPLSQLNLAVKDFASGKWDKTVDIDRSDEIGQLAKSFNDMSEQLKDSFSKLNSVISQANQVGSKITSSTTQIAGAGKQLEKTVVQQAGSTNKVKTNAIEIADTSGELVKTMEKMAQQVQATADAGSHSQASLLEMAAAMGELAEATRLISLKLRVMNEKANNINSVVSSIINVADRTNLISLNASIEAEKAGETGAGFAVVAREVRWLADKASLAASEIEEMVKEIQASVADGVKEMDKFSNQVNNQVQLVNRISGEISLAIEQVQSLKPQFEQVSHSMEGQFEGAQQISLAISQLSEASVQTVASLQQTNQVLEQLDDTAQVLQGIISNKVAL